MMIANPMPTKWFGHDLSHDDLEALTIGLINHKVLKKDPELHEKKWFDYRPLHPAQATYLMVHYYNRAFGDFLRRAVDMKKAYVSGITGKDFMLTRERNSFWRLRQLIDELGMRYDFFLRHAMNWHIENGFGKGVPHPPRPAHILNRSDMIVSISNDWANERRGRIQFASHPRYTAAEWVGSPDQLAYESDLVAQIQRREHKQYGLHAALYLYDSLRIETAIERFQIETVGQAIDRELGT